ncbi:hypothetical protein GCM10023200_24830 [Actinomycetospora chlora]|uniref:DUF6286 domain-containing protein n=1 Tax=Actinomycetospora chlora TaxID=663608 RepID=A0ABP9B1X7_9PSEU
MTRHSRRTLPALLTALVLVAVGALAATSAVQTLLGRTPLVALDTVTGVLGLLTWQAPAVLVAAGVAAVLGLVLLVAGVVPGRTHVLPLATRPAGPADPHGAGVVTGGWHRHDLATRLRRRALAVEGVERASVRVRRSRVRVAARTHRAGTAPVREALTAAVAGDLDALGLARRPRLRVGVSSTRKEG